MAPRSARMLARAAVLSCVALALPAGASAQRLRTVGSFDRPVYATAAPGDDRRLFVVEQGGRIKIIRDGQELAANFVDLTGVVLTGGERGLLSVAFPPDYQTTGKLYVFYTAQPRVVPTARNAGDLIIEEYTRSGPEGVNLASARQVLRIPHATEGNHNGGQLQFGHDGMLYIATGDGGGGGDPNGNGQNRDTLLGKILRIDPRPMGSAAYRIPAGNPFVGRSGRDEIWHYGLRNPWRFSFDRVRGDMAIGDVGQGGWEEVDFRPSGVGGANFGWNRCEGTHTYPGGASGCSFTGHVRPALEYRTHQNDTCAVTGGYVIRDPRLPGLAGRYVYADFCVGDLRTARLGTGGASGDAALRNPSSGNQLHVDSLASFGEDLGGCIYAASLGGTLYRLEPTNVNSPVPCNARDLRAPGLAVSAASPQAHRGRRGVVLSARCDEACSVRGFGGVAISGQQSRPPLISMVRSGAAGANLDLRLGISDNTRARISSALRAGRSVRALVQVRARDRADNTRTSSTRSITIVR